MKRIMVATFFGLVMGGICATAAFRFGLLKFSAVLLAWILLNRTVMGFAIGVSGLKLHWAWNGIVMGLAIGSVFSYFLFMNTSVGLSLGNFVVNGFFGLMIEFFTSFVFKARSLAAPRAMERAAAA